jgi:hypothetical protein
MQIQLITDNIEEEEQILRDLNVDELGKRDFLSR